MAEDTPDFLEQLLTSLRGGREEPTVHQEGRRKYLLLGRVPFTSETPAGLYFAVEYVDGQHIEVPSPVVIVQVEAVRDRQQRAIQLTAYESRVFGGRLAGARLGNQWDTAFMSSEHQESDCVAALRHVGLPPKVRERYADPEVPLPPLEELLCPVHWSLVAAADEMTLAAARAVKPEESSPPEPAPPEPATVWAQCTQCGWGERYHQAEVEVGDVRDGMACPHCGIGPVRLEPEDDGGAP